MSDLTWEEEQEEERIPFDSEPIERKPGFERTKSIKPPREKSRDSGNLWKVITAVLMIVVVGLSVAFINVNSQIDELKSERGHFVNNITSEGGDSGYAIAKGMLSTVCISASSKNNGNSVDAFFSGSMASRGSGVILEVNKETGDAYILTNFHVVCTQNTLEPFAYHWILLWDSITPIKAEYVGGSYQYDIAVLKVEGSKEIQNSSCATVSVAKSTEIALGEEVVAIGNSVARNLRISTGVIAVEEELMGTSDMYISHSADVNSGNSGGGLFNNSGELVGIVNAKFMDVNPQTGELIIKEVIHGMNYAIPSEIAVSIAKNIIRNNGTALRPTIGLLLGKGLSYQKKNYEIRSSDGFGYTTYELVVSSSNDYFSDGDVLTSMTYKMEDGTEVNVELNRLFSIESHIFNWKKGTEVTIKVNGKKEVKITIEKTTQVT